MKYDTTQALVDLVASISHDPDEADWHDVHEQIEMLPDPATVLRDLLHHMHEEYL